MKTLMHMDCWHSIGSNITEVILTTFDWVFVINMRTDYLTLVDVYVFANVTWNFVFKLLLKTCLLCVVAAVTWVSVINMFAVVDINPQIPTMWDHIL
jgi:hypothetical protein